jgi:hypothetical protein
MPAFRPVQARSKGQHHASDVWPYYGAGQCSVAAISRALHARSTLVRTNLHRIHETQRRIHTRHLIRMRCLVQQSAQHTAHSIRRCAVFHSIQHTAYGAVLCFTACSTQHTALCCVSQHAAHSIRRCAVFHSMQQSAWYTHGIALCFTASHARAAPAPRQQLGGHTHTHEHTHTRTHRHKHRRTHAHARTHTHAPAPRQQLGGQGPQPSQPRQPQVAAEGISDDARTHVSDDDTVRHTHTHTRCRGRQR